jgi:hypothetical protein
MNMNYFGAKTGAAAVTAAVAAVGWAFIPAARADEQYKADRTYCMSGRASEARDLCLKEAAAAQAERQRGSHARGKHVSAKHDKVSGPHKSASTP